MKWGGFNREGEEKLNRIIGKLFRGRTTYYLLTIATLAMLLAENIKWRPQGR